LLLASVSAWFTAHDQPQNEVDTYKKFLIDHGEKLTVDELLPPRTPIESNSLTAVQDAFGMLGDGSQNIPAAMKMIAPGRALVGFTLPMACGDDFTNSWDDFSNGVVADLPAITFLHQVLDRPKLDFELDYKKGAELLLPHLMLLKKATQRLEAATICQLHNGENGAAVTNILTMLALVQRNEREGVLISHLVRMAMTGITVIPTWELLQATNVTDTQLAAVQDGWARLEFISDAMNVFALERAWGINEIQKARASPGGFFNMTGFGASSSSSGSLLDWPPDWEAITERPRYAIGSLMWRASWSYTDELRAMKSEQIILETLRTMQTNRSQFYKSDCDVMTKRLSSLGITHAGDAFFRALKIPDLTEIFGDWGLGNVVNKVIRAETANRVVITAIALRRFQLGHAHLPETMNDLVPEYIASVPIDPYDGKPLKYRLNPDETYLLYSVGEDGKDDGGDPTNTSSSSSSPYWQGNKVRDWVWPQPATAVEVQNYFETQAK